jgi:hypothetical protein
MKLCVFFFFILSSFFISLISAAAEGLSSPNIAGQYQCTIQSSQGENFHSTVTYTLDTRNSNFSQGYSSYHFDGISQYGTHYLGYAIAQGNQLAIYAHNASPEKPQDAGVEISTITEEKISNKNPRFILNNLMYSPKDLYNPNDFGSVISIRCEQTTPLSH